MKTTGACLPRSGAAMRMFVALEISEEVRGRMRRFAETCRDLAPEARWVSPESLHVTLKFIGEHPPDLLEPMKRALSTVGPLPFSIAFRGYGFFPDAASPRLFWLGIGAPHPLFELAEQIDRALSGLGIARETHAFTPHLTLARAGEAAPRRSKTDRPNLRFLSLQERLAAAGAPQFGSMMVNDFFLYQSQASSAGPRYRKLAQFSLPAAP